MIKVTYENQGALVTNEFADATDFRILVAKDPSFKLGLEVLKGDTTIAIFDTYRYVTRESS